MRFLAFLIVAGVILSVARALTLVLVLLIVLSLIWAVLTKPFEVLGFILLTALCEVASAHPLAALWFGFMLAVLVVCRESNPTDSLHPIDDDSATRDKLGTGFQPD